MIALIIYIFFKELKDAGNIKLENFLFTTTTITRITITTRIIYGAITDSHNKNTLSHKPEENNLINLKQISNKHRLFILFFFFLKDNELFYARSWQGLVP